MKKCASRSYGWNGYTYVAGNAPTDLLEMLRHIADFWNEGAPGWAPEKATESLQRTDFLRMVQLAEEIPTWFADDSPSKGQQLLAWVTLGTLAESILRWFLSIYERDYRRAPLFCVSSEIPPEGVFFHRLIDYFDEYIWAEEDRSAKCTAGHAKSEMTGLLHTIREQRNAIHCGKTRLASWEKWRACVEKFLVLVCELEGRVPYPDDHVAFPASVSKICGHYWAKSMRIARSR